MNKRLVSLGIVGIGLAILVVVLLVGPSGLQLAGDRVQIDDDDLGGVVTGARGPEAGVWVIAETSDLPTTFAKIVVTDDAGRYVVPDLPHANYNVWVRGYGLVDSSKVRAAPGRILNLNAVAAPSPQAAAQYYPAGYWASLIEIPGKHEFPGTGPQGNGISRDMKSQAQWIQWLKTGSCYTCHQLGNKATRELPAALGQFPSSDAAWGRRIQSGQAGGDMVAEASRFGLPRVLSMLASWTDRIAAGEIPPAPPRPRGLERNVVVTQWDWADPKAYLHDQISTDRRHPSINATGPIYGSPELSADYLPVLDPVRHTVSRVGLTVRDPSTQPGAAQRALQPSPYWGDEVLWTSKANVHNPMMDDKGRVWLTATVRPPANPDYCKAGSSHPSAQAFPLNTAGRHVAMYDPKTTQLTHISTCFETHHLMFAEDGNNTLWLNGYGSQVVGWINTKMFDDTKDEVKSQGWTALILDTNGNGRRDAYVEPDRPIDPTKDTRIADAYYSIAPAADGSIWGSILGFPGAVVRLNPGSNPPATALAERYEVPWGDPQAPVQGYSPRGMDVDRNGVVWMALGSGHIASFDRRTCTAPLNGPNATGTHCPEGWTLYPEPIPQFKNVTDSGATEGSYYTWVDQFDAFGLGSNTPINTGNQSDGLLALKDGQWVVLRVPYPMGFYAKGLDGRIDDPNAGWKGRGLWTTVSSRTPFHMETGKGTPPKAMHFQLRPDPLAK